MLEVNLDKLYKLLEGAYEDLDKMKDMISKLQLEARKIALKDVPGVEGVFDGKVLITDEGDKLEVPANYAAKSRIVYGDRLKVYEEGGRQMFKQVEKVPRKKVPAVVSKKEGKFFALTEYGGHELSTVAVDFNKILVNDKIQIILPEDNLKAPFATLDKLIDQKEVVEVAPVDAKNSATIVKETAKKSEVVPEVKEDNKIGKSIEKEQVQAIGKEFVMDLSTKEEVEAARVPEPKKEVITVAEKAASVASVEPTVLVASEEAVNTPKSVQKPSSASRSSNAPRSSDNPSKPPRPSGSRSRPSSAPTARKSSSPAPKREAPRRDTSPSSPASTTPAAPFILEDDDLR